jgi:Na+-driven multidrug efflux pump
MAQRLADIDAPLNDDPPPEDAPPPKHDQRWRLGGRPALRTLLGLSFGPLISLLVNGFYGIVTSIWISQAEGPEGIAAVSVLSNLDNIGRSVGFFLNCAATSKISALFGENRENEAGQLICDLLRTCVICGMIVPAILLPVAQPLARWYGSDPELVRDSFLYLAPLSGCITVTCIFLLMCGCLQAEGRAFMVGAIQMGSLVLNMLILNPLFLLGYKWGMVGAAMSTICAELIPAAWLTVQYFRGKFSVKPDWHGLFRKFSPDTRPAIFVGVSQLVMQISRSIPSVVVRKFIGMSVEQNPYATFQDALAGFTAVRRICGVTEPLRFAIAMGLLPAISFAYASSNFKRIFWFIWHACWINFVWGAIVCIVSAFAARYLAMAISRSEGYLKWAAPMIVANNWEAPFAWARNIVQTLLQGLQYGGMATVYSFCSTFFASIGATLLLYYTDKSNFVRLMYGYPISSAFAVVVGVFFLILPLKKLWALKTAAAQEVGDGIEDMVNVDVESPGEEPKIEEPPESEDVQTWLLNPDNFPGLGAGGWRDSIRLDQ